LKITKEVKTGIFAILSIVLFIYGYSYLKGANIFNKEKVFYVCYENVAGLAISAPVTINGFAVGKVKQIDFGNTKGELVVAFTLNKDFEFSKNSIVKIYSTSIIGGNALSIIPENDGKNIAQSGDTLKGEIQQGMLETVTSGLKPLEKRIYQTLSGLDTLLYSFNDVLNETTRNDLKQAVASLNNTMNSFEGVSSRLNVLLKNNQPKLDQTFAYLETTTENLAKFSDSLSQIDINALAKNLEGTLHNFEAIMSKIEKGEGSIGKLLNDEQLYKNLEGASKELEELLRDLKENPKRYVHISVFGKKAQAYKPEEEINK